jgi:glycosyltransferase involved in cell wall biosynthesis
MSRYIRYADAHRKATDVIGEGFMQSCSTQVIIAALNEEPGIGPTITELVKYVHPQHVLVVDGHSSDRTVDIAKECGADILFQDGVGKGDAISKALTSADLNTDYVVLTDADYTYPAVYVPEMVAILHQSPQVGMVCGNRFNEQVDPQAWRSSFYFGNRFLAFAHNLLNGVALRDPLTGLRVVRAEILKDWSVKSKGFDVEVELNHQVEREGFGIVEVPIKYRPRLGAKKLKVRHGATILKRILLETI